MDEEHDDNSAKPDMKEIRREDPSGWLELTDNQTLPLVIDALMDAPPGKEYNKKELGDAAGLSRESIREYIDILLKFGIMTEVPDTNPPRYKLNDRGKVTVSLFELNSALNSVGSGEERDVSEKSDQTTDYNPTMAKSNLYASGKKFGQEIGES